MKNRPFRERIGFALAGTFVLLAAAGCTSRSALGVTSAYVHPISAARAHVLGDGSLAVRTTKCPLGRKPRETILRAVLNSPLAPPKREVFYDDGPPDPRAYAITFVRRGQMPIIAAFSPSRKPQESALIAFNGNLHTLPPTDAAAVADMIAASGCDRSKSKGKR